MKKFLISLVIICSMVIPCVTATESYIEYSSGEQDDGAIYIDSYEDYLNIYGDMDEQELYKEEYLSNVASAITYFDAEKGQETVKARILTVGETKEYYSYDGYGAYKIVYQPIEVQILEGEHKGETAEGRYILTADSYDNLKIKEVEKNQKINVILEETDDKLYAYATTVDAAVNRVSSVIVLVIITIIFALIYLGKKSFKMLPQLLLIADVILLIFAPEVLAGRSILWLTIVTSILYMIVDSALKLGLNAKMVASIISTLGVTIVATMGLIAFADVATFSGITYEVLNVIEAFPKGTIDFFMLYISSFILMCVIATSDVACKTIKLHSTMTKETAKTEIKDYVSEKLPTIFGILLITITPKYLYLLIAKYTVDELMNSEILLTEIVRILFLIIATTLTVQVAEYAKKFFVKD